MCHDSLLVLSLLVVSGWCLGCVRLCLGSVWVVFSIVSRWFFLYVIGILVVFKGMLVMSRSQLCLGGVWEVSPLSPWHILVVS